MSYWRMKDKKKNSVSIEELKAHVKKHGADFDIHVKHIPGGYSGQILRNAEEIHLAPRVLNRIVRILAHEWIHDMRPGWGESKVLKCEMKLMRKMTLRNKVWFLLDCFNKIQVPAVTGAKKRSTKSPG